MGEKPWDILSDPLRNKGTAFTTAERDLFQLHGVLPYHTSTIEEQVQRRYSNFKSQSSDLAKHLFLSNLLQRNTTLFYRLVSEHLSEMLPLIYTPTVGEFSSHFSNLYTFPRGLFLSYPHRDKIDQMLSRIEDEIEIVVVTDGERILGLGDLGAGGIAISIGKLCLYTLFGGIDPRKTLPVVLDVGTDNAALLGDPLYLGWNQARLRGPEYDQFVDQFVRAIQKRFPKALLQWEDFGRDHAKPLLERYRGVICSFNDDIQGTAAVVLAALFTAVKMTHSQLENQKIAIFGGGSAGIGICHYLLGAMMAAGISKQKAVEALYVIDVNGLVHTGQEVPPHQRPFARLKTEVEKWDISNPDQISLLDVVKNGHPTVLIGVSAQSGAFDKETVQAMCSYSERPIIFPLSNPTSKSEAHPEDLLEWTKGKAIIATGSPFENIAQCNNVYIFPGIGLGAICCQPSMLTDTMFYRAAEILSRNSPMLHAHTDTLFPPFEKLRSISRAIALGVMEVAEAEGLSPKMSANEREKRVDAVMWSPKYIN